MERRVWQIALCSVCSLYKSDSMVLPVSQSSWSVKHLYLSLIKLWLKRQDYKWKNLSDLYFFVELYYQFSRKVEFARIFGHLFFLHHASFSLYFSSSCCAVIPCCRGVKGGIRDCWGDVGINILCRHTRSYITFHMLFQRCSSRSG